MALRIASENRATVVCVWVDNGYQRSGVRGLQGQVGAKLVFRDHEVMTRLLRRDFLPFPGETPCLAFLRAHDLSLFPQRLCQSPCHRHARSLSWRVEELRRHGIQALGATSASLYLRDTQPLPVWGYRRDQSHRAFKATADYGVYPSPLAVRWLPTSSAVYVGGCTGSL